MDWQDTRRSDNIEDRRDGGGGGDAGGSGGIGVGTGGLGIGAILVLALIGYATGIDPRVLIGGAEVITGHASQYQSDPYDPSGRPPQQVQAPSGQSAPAGQTAPAGRSAASDRTGDFVAAVLGEIEDVWTQQLPAQTGVNYVKPRLVLYSGVTRSGCGTAQSATGPFYCPIDQKIYLDTAFFDEMKRKLGGGGDFAYAYVIAHEVGHHVQNLLGILPKVHQQQEESDQAASNALSVRLELQADCFAGVWAANANASKGGHYLDAGDAAQAETTAAAIGDDMLQKAARGYAVPDSFTHGTSQQRQKWLETGLSTGKVKSCNTFAP